MCTCLVVQLPQSSDVMLELSGTHCHQAVPRSSCGSVRMPYPRRPPANRTNTPAKSRDAERGTEVNRLRTLAHRCWLARPRERAAPSAKPGGGRAAAPRSGVAVPLRRLLSSTLGYGRGLLPALQRGTFRGTTRRIIPAQLGPSVRLPVSSVQLVARTQPVSALLVNGRSSPSDPGFSQQARLAFFVVA